MAKPYNLWSQTESILVKQFKDSNLLDETNKHFNMTKDVSIRKKTRGG